MSLLVPVLLFPTLSVLYAVSVCVFLFLWGESPFFALLQNRSCQWSVAWWTAAVAAAVAAAHAEPIDALERTSTVRSALLLLLLLLQVLPFALGSLYLLRLVRVELVEGGPPPPSFELPHQGEPPHNKVVVVTGCNTGIGKETLRLLLQSSVVREEGATVKGVTKSPLPHKHYTTTIVMACRSVEKAKEAWRDIAGGISPPSSDRKLTVDTVACDLSDLASVRRAAETILQKHPTIHVLINNAGLMMERQQFTSADTPMNQPYELVLTANHLGHFLLTHLLQPTEAVINVTSCTYALADPDFLDDPFCTRTRPYTMFGQYAASKACNILFTSELARRNPHLRCHAVHPGIVRTDVVRNMPWYLRVPNTVFGLAVQCFQKTPAQGAWNTLHALHESYRPEGERLSPTQRSWQYWVNRRPGRVLPWVTSPDKAAMLWELSSRLVGLSEAEKTNNGTALTSLSPQCSATS